MGQMLEALLNLQAVERKLSTVRRRLKSRQRAVFLQLQLVKQLEDDWQTLHDRSMDRRKESDSLSVDLRAKEDTISKRRGALNTAKTNKEYAAILTEINTAKADNAKLEEQALKVMQEVEDIGTQAADIKGQIEAGQEHVLEVTQASEVEVARLNTMLAELEAQREQAAGQVDPQALTVFSRMVDTYDGEAVAIIEIHGRKPPYSYVCGGCYMGLNAEHANALRVRDEIRTCDNCGRILCLDPKTEGSPAT